MSAFRAHTVRAGLHARCKAMVECGWAWGEMGKEGMRALESLDVANGHGASHFCRISFPFFPESSCDDDVCVRIVGLLTIVRKLCTSSKLCPFRVLASLF